MLKVRPYSSKGKPIFFSEGGLASRIYNYIVLYIYNRSENTAEGAFRWCSSELVGQMERTIPRRRAVDRPEVHGDATEGRAVGRHMMPAEGTVKDGDLAIALGERLIALGAQLEWRVERCMDPLYIWTTVRISRLLPPGPLLLREDQTDALTKRMP